MKAPSPGIYHDVPEAQYRAWDAVNISSLLDIDEYSPAHYKANLESPDTPTEAKFMGSAIHCHVLTPDLFNGIYAVGPDVDKRSKAWKDFVNGNEGKFHLTGKQYEIVHGVSLAATELDTLGLLQGGWSEVSMVWVDPQTGILSKGRLDHLAGLSIMDLKTTRDAREKEFAWDYYKFHYYVKAAWYMQGLFHASMQGGKEPIEAEVFHIYAIEKVPPYGGIHYKCHEVDLMLGEVRIEAMLKTLKKCIDTGTWPKYKPGARTIRIPGSKQPVGWDILNGGFDDE